MGNEFNVILGLVIIGTGILAWIISKDADDPNEWCIKISFKYPLRILGVSCIFWAIWLIGHAIGKGL